MSVKLPKMTQAEIDQLITEQFLCRVAFKGTSAPHIMPFQYVFFKGSLYFHFARYGKKLGLLGEGNPVCVEIERYTPDLGEYCFVVLTGKLQIVIDTQEKALVLSRLVMQAKAKGLSTNFLAAHGLQKGSAWSSLKAEKSPVIVKLVDVSANGLKSP